jgi:exosortase/archaeosortase family protein
MLASSRWRVVFGSFLVLISLTILRFFQLSGPDLFWIALMGLGVVVFAVGSRWVIYEVHFFESYRDMWPVLCAAMVVAWLIHAVQLENYASSSPLGAFFDKWNVFATVVLLHWSNIPVTVSGNILSFGPPSQIGAVQVTPLCGGFLSLLMFLAAFGFVTLDVGRTLGVARLVFLLVAGGLVTFAATIVRVFIVILVGFHWGLDALNIAHTYLAYILFLAVVCAFWYTTLRWSNQITMSAHAPTK